MKPTMQSISDALFDKFAGLSPTYHRVYREFSEKERTTFNETASRYQEAWNLVDDDKIDEFIEIVSEKIITKLNDDV